MRLSCYFLILGIAFQVLLYSSHTTILGDEASSNTWIYLCGLKEDLNSESTENETSILNDLGKDLHIKIIAINPPKRSISFNNKLCWPHENKSELQQTHQYIASITNKECISGYLGFSNGGFFLLSLAQNTPLGVPIIAIGAGGSISDITAKNQITLLIGKYDSYHYDAANQFYQQSTNTLLEVDLIEYEDGHCIPKELLYGILKPSVHKVVSIAHGCFNASLCDRTTSPNRG